MSFVLSDDKPMPWPVFSRAMETLVAMRGADLLRVKGFLSVEGCKGPVVVQFVQHLAPPPVELETMAGRQPTKPRRVHHAQYFGKTGEGRVRGGARA